MISKARRNCAIVLPLTLLILFFVSGCDLSSPDYTTFVPPKLPAQPSIYKFDLSAKQGLRDLTSDFSTISAGADTGILLLQNEKVEILASGTAIVQPGGKPSGPDGVPSCNTGIMPEPSLSCYSVIYSVGVYGRAGEVGTHANFEPTTTGNLFLGVNTPHLANDSGSFHMTVIIIPPGKVTGLWKTPDAGFDMQGTSVKLAAYAFAQNVANLAVHFTLKIAGQSPMSICDGISAGVDLYTCNWNLMMNGTYFHNGPVTLGFTINGTGQTGNTPTQTINPDGLRAGMITYEQTQLSTNYAGFAATDNSGLTTFQKVSGRWTIPTANCAPGENSDSAVWVGMTSRNETDNSLLAQLGTESACQNGLPLYFIWWEMFPNPSVPLNQPLQPGDVATASVTYQHGAYQLSIDVPQEGTHFTTTQSGNSSATGVAECIVEAPFIIVNINTNQGHLAQLTNFGQVSVQCQINNNEPVADGPQDYIYQMQTDSGAAKATTSPLDQTGTMFTVTWNQG